MKLIRGSFIGEIDRYTIEHEPIASIDLMERASVAILKAFVAHHSASNAVFIFAGPGNNGGDGLALARHLVLLGYDVRVYVLQSETYSPDHLINIERLKQQGIVRVSYIEDSKTFPQILANSVIVDSLFGSGLTRYLTGLARDLVLYLNSQHAFRVAIDIPSGLFSELNPSSNTNPVFCAHQTITLQFPKLSFFFAENDAFVGDWIVVDIGLHPQAIHDIDSPFFLVDVEQITQLMPCRSKYDHKGDRGHCQIIAGSSGMYGAAILSAKACLNAGAGLVSVHIPSDGLLVMQQALPEVMAQVDAHKEHLSAVDYSDRYTAHALGPGIGTHEDTVAAVTQFIETADKPIVVDADGLNIIAQNPSLLGQLPKNSIITPHVGEFRRLFGNDQTSYSRMETAQEKAAEHQIIIVLKGAHTQIVSPNGDVYFNATGNSAMATAGSGDALTGIIAAFLAQGLLPLNAAILGVYMHGIAGDLAFEKNGFGPIRSGNIVDAIPLAMGELYKLIDNRFSK